MIDSGQKTSLLIPSQLPEFVRDEPSYNTFVTFVQAYYEWMEQNDNVTDRTKNILNYKDVDKTTSEFLDYFTNDFLSYFPKEILADEKKVIKIAKELYQSKGTPASYQFLFKVLYGTDVDFFYTKDVVLKASAGKWYVAKSLKLATDNPNFLNIQNLRVFGETTKSIATVETSVIAGTKTEVFISNIERLFQSGEIIRVVDSNNQDVLFNGQPLRAKLVGQISQIKINTKNRGSLYQPGDPVIVYEGLNSNTGIGATATVGETTKGSISRIKVTNGGFGYRSDPYGKITLTNGGGAAAHIASLSPTSANTANATYIPIDYIGQKQLLYIGNVYSQGVTYSSGNNTRDPRSQSGGVNWTGDPYVFANNLTANANTTLANAFTFTSFTTYPISSVLVDNGGGGLIQAPVVSAHSYYDASISSWSSLTAYKIGDIVGYGGISYLANETNTNNRPDISGSKWSILTPELASLGILAPIQIVSSGTYYRANDRINIVGGTGYGAYANVTSVGANGEILTVSYVYPQNDAPHHYPLGGMGYRLEFLPTANVVSSNATATGASLSIPGILGSGASFYLEPDRIGEITTINIQTYGEDYIATPNVSLKVQDIVVSNVSLTNIPQTGDIVYQGTDFANSSYKATVSETNITTPYGDATRSIWTVRVYNYNAIPSKTSTLKVNNKNITMPVTDVTTYGDGTAKATATFLNGLTISGGQYLDTAGQLSAYDVLESEIYNNFTYEITLEKEIAKYREILLNLLHPTGMKVLGRYALKSNTAHDFTASSLLEAGQPLSHYTQTTGSYATMTSNWTNQSNNIINLYALGAGANLETYIFVGGSITLTTANGFVIHSEVVNVQNGSANTVTLKDNVWTTFANVAYVTANSGTNIINITSLTNSYNIINNGTYSNTAYPLKDIVYAGDYVLVANNTEKQVQSVNYTSGIIYLNGNLSSSSNSLMSIRRTISTSIVRIDGIVGTVYYPLLTDELGNVLTTEDGLYILLG